jgi:MATE family multidrug resistance protein
MNFVDRMFLLWYSEEAFAATMPAAMLEWTIFCLPMGIAGYVGTFVAQYYGAGRYERIGVAMAQAVRFSIFVTPILLIGVPLAPYIFDLANHEPALAAEETKFFQTLCFGAGGAVFAAGLTGFYTGLGRTRVVMFGMVSTAILDAILGWFLIFGHAGFPRMGIVGAGVSTVISQWVRVAIYWYHMTRPAERQKYGISFIGPYDGPLMWRLLRFGTPNGLHLLVEGGGFTLFILLLGKLGTEAVSASTLAFNVNSVAFVPMYGVGMAVSTLVGQQIGGDRPDRAARAAWTGFHMAIFYTGLFALLYVALPDIFLFGHRQGIGSEQFAELRNTTIVLLRFVAVYCLFDAVNIIFASAIKGAGDTRFIVLVNLITSPVAIGLTVLGIRYFAEIDAPEQGLMYCWWVLTGWVSALGLIYLGRFLQGKWREMRVIEPDPDGVPLAPLLAAETDAVPAIATEG